MFRIRIGYQYGSRSSILAQYADPSFTLKVIQDFFTIVTFIVCDWIRIRILNEDLSPDQEEATHCGLRQ